MHQANAKDKAGFLSRIFLFWMNSLIRLGSKRPLNEDDLFELSDEDQAEFIVEDFGEIWEEEVNSAKKQDRQPRLWKAMARFIPWSDYIWLIILKSLDSLSIYSRPVLLWIYLKAALGQSQQNTPYVLAAAAAGIGASSFISAFAFNHHNFTAFMIGMRIKIACTGLIHKKV